MSRTDYESIAASYDTRYEQIGYDGSAHVVAKLLCSFPAATVLEVGCGTGHWLAALRDRGCAVTGIDTSQSMLAKAREKLPDIELTWGRAEKLPWPAGSFDRVLCVNALHHFEDARAFIREARRVLRPGGLLLNMGLDPHTREDRWFVYDYFVGTRATDEARFAPTALIRDWMREAGLSQTETQVAWRFNWTHDYRGAIDPKSTSQLSNLNNREFEAGMALLAASHRKVIEAGETLPLIVDLRLVATRGWVPET